MALACKPKILIADEPTTALDVTIQAQILKLMNDLKQSTGTAIIFMGGRDSPKYGKTQPESTFFEL